MNALLPMLCSAVTCVYSLYRLVSSPDPSLAFLCMKLCLMSFRPISCLQITGFKNRLAQLCKDEIPEIIRMAQLGLL